MPIVQRRRASPDDTSSLTAIELGLAALASSLALLAAVVAAVGPAKAQSYVYSWPPPVVRTATPERGWYTSLPLLGRVPEELTVNLPCGLAPPVRPTSKILVFGTARRPTANAALRIVLEGDQLAVYVGAVDRYRVQWPQSCPLKVSIADGILETGSRRTALETGTHDMPIVTGLFTTLDLQRDRPPSVLLRTRPYGTAQTSRQSFATALALVLVLISFVVIGRRELLGAARSAAQAKVDLWSSDLVVGLALALWWILSPSFFDDGWLTMEHQLWDEIGEFNLFYEAWGTTVPLGLWIEWLRHPVFESTAYLVFLRLPTLAALILLWVACRRSLALAIGRSTPEAVRWTLAATFVVGVMAWGMTLRLEPVLALFGTLGLGAMLSFVESPRAAPLAVTALLMTLAVSIHPAGVIVAAPVFACLAPLASWLRHTRLALASLAVLGASAFALALTLGSLGADL